MKKLLYLLLFPLSSFAQITDANLNLEADTIRTETHAGRNTAQRVGRMFKNLIASKSNINGNTGILAIAGGGTGTSSPGLVAGTNISITGSWPNQTINSSGGGGGGITNSAPNNVLMKSDGTNAVTSGLSVSSGYLSGLNGLSGGFIYFGAFSASAARRVEIEENSNPASGVLYPLRLSSVPNGVSPSIGFGTGLELATRSLSGSNIIGATIESVSTNITGGSENFDLVFKNTSTGVGLLETFRIKSNGDLVAANTGWNNISLFGNWSNNTGTFRYRKDLYGMVYLSGVIQDATTSSYGSTVTNTGAVPVPIVPCAFVVTYAGNTFLLSVGTLGQLTLTTLSGAYSIGGGIKIQVCYATN